MERIEHDPLDQLMDDGPLDVAERKRLPQLSRGVVVTVALMVAGLVVFSSLQSKFRLQQTVIAQHYHQPAVSSYTLGQQERAHLLYMREEEKLALDVYHYLAERWGQRIFYSISRSEQRHTSAMAQLLKQFGLPDPALNASAGVFRNPELSRLYQSLITRGEQSLLEALQVGALIEEVDIHDLDTAIQASTHPTVTTAYRRIQSGSYHHLRAFVHSIEVAGGRYRAQHLPQSRVDEIVGGALSIY